jgi:hypothetical protein
MLRMFLARILFWLQGFQFHLSHQVTDLFTSQRYSPSVQLKSNLTISIEWMAAVNIFNLVTIFFMPWFSGLPFMIDSTSIHVQQPALSSYRQLLIMWINQSGSLPYSCLYFFFYVSSQPFSFDYTKSSC